MGIAKPLPRICIALGLPDVATLLDHARREAGAGETFLEFRLDFLDNPCAGAQAIGGFLEQFPDCLVLATCRRHQNHGNFNATPPMEPVVNRMLRIPADAYKVVTTARKPSDNVRVLTAAKALPRQRM